VKEVVGIIPVLLLEMWPTVLGMFLLGLWTGRKNIFAHPEPYLPFFRKARWPALVLGLACNLASVIAVHLTVPGQFSWITIVAVLGTLVGAPPLTFFYVSTIILLTQKQTWHERLKPLASVGRMALTNYLMQSVICTTIFYSGGLGLYASLGPLAGLGLTVLIYAVQIPLSVFWLRHFRFGPMEWLWRTFTYGKLQPMRL
jgi:uncharacterized protein